jgi:hypothetical protein
LPAVGPFLLLLPLGALHSAAGPALPPAALYGPDEYYDWRALPGEIKHPKRKWAYEGQRNWTEKRFIGAGIQSSKTHATRKQAARQEVEGVDEAQIRRAGRWSNDVPHLATIPRKFMRKIAGFLLPPEGRGGTELMR